MGRLRIAVVHSFYSSAQPSGENVIVRDEVSALRRAGHEVRLFAARTDELEGDLLYPVRSGLRVATGHGRHPLRSIEDFGADVVHVHNLFPNFGRRWVERCQMPVVHTLHNYRPLCIAGTLYRDGDRCTLCLGGARWPGVRHACYRGSRGASALVSLGRHPDAASDPVLRRADAVIMLTPLQQEVYAAGGYEPERVVVQPHFLPDDAVPGWATGTPPGTSAGPAATGGLLVVGRLSQEKGIEELVERWPRGTPLEVVGSGPLRERLEARAHPNVHVAGSVPRPEVLSRLGRSQGLVFPSRWFETFGLAYLEALAVGVPTLAFDGNTVARMVQEDGTGAVASWDEPLGPQVRRFLHDREVLAGRCRPTFAARYSEDAFLERRVALYARLLEGDRSVARGKPTDA